MDSTNKDTTSTPTLVKVAWRKTYHVYGFGTVPEGDYDSKKHAAIELASKQEPTLNTGGPNDLDWGWTDFYSEVPPTDPEEGLFETMEGPDDQKYDEWFDI